MKPQQTIRQGSLTIAQKANGRSLDILFKYPEWRNRVLETEVLSSLPPNYQPDIIQLFDHQGLLASRHYEYVFSSKVPIDHKSEFIAVLFDDNLVLFVIGNEVLINRLNGISIFAQFDMGA